MTLVQIIMRKDDNGTRTGFYTEIKFTMVKYYIMNSFSILRVIGCFNRKFINR